MLNALWLWLVGAYSWRQVVTAWRGRAALVLTLSLLSGCSYFLPTGESAPAYCYQIGTSTEAWYCDPGASFPADTVLDSEKDEHRPPVVLIPCITDSECAAAYPGTNGDPTP